MANQQVTIRRATPSDIDSILEIAASLSLERIGEEHARQLGFLVSGFDRDTYESWLDKTDCFLVAEDGNQKVGFMLAYDSKCLDASLRVDAALKLLLNEEFVVVKQIGVRESHRRKGVARELYRHLIDKSENRFVLAAIVADPRNEPSIHFHESFGFYPFIEILADDNIAREVWYRPTDSKYDILEHLTARALMPRKNIQHLMQQYESATQLYMHEDTLNWTKVSVFLTLTILVYAGYAYLWKNPDESIFLVGGLALIGMAFFALFYVSLKSGLAYFDLRKMAVLDIEKSIRAFVPELKMVVTRAEKKALTRRFLDWLPLFAIVVWSISSIVLFLKVLIE